MPWGETGPKPLSALILRHPTAEVVRGDRTLVVTFRINDNGDCGDRDLSARSTCSVPSRKIAEERAQKSLPLVEQPLVSAWVDASLTRMTAAAREQGMPFTPHKLTPEVEDSFWVNLIGKGYPAPRLKFRLATAHTSTTGPAKGLAIVSRNNTTRAIAFGTSK